jgi:hypothetical protein
MLSISKYLHLNGAESVRIWYPSDRLDANNIFLGDLGRKSRQVIGMRNSACSGP